MRLHKFILYFNIVLLLAYLVVFGEKIMKGQMEFLLILIIFILALISTSVYHYRKLKKMEEEE